MQRSFKGVLCIKSKNESSFEENRLHDGIGRFVSSKNRHSGIICTIVFTVRKLVDRVGIIVVNEKMGLKENRSRYCLSSFIKNCGVSFVHNLFLLNEQE